jgi:hypothetical protein
VLPLSDVADFATLLITKFSGEYPSAAHPNHLPNRLKLNMTYEFKYQNYSVRTFAYDSDFSHDALISYDATSYVYSSKLNDTPNAAFTYTYLPIFYK